MHLRTRRTDCFSFEERFLPARWRKAQKDHVQNHDRRFDSDFLPVSNIGPYARGEPIKKYFYSNNSRLSTASPTIYWRSRHRPGRLHCL